MNYILENETMKVEISSTGGNIEKIINKKTGNNHYWEYDKEVWPRRTSVCFPVCGLMTEETYTLDEETYEMPPHGFLREMELKAISVEPERVCLVAESDEWTKKRYPFKFLYEMIFTLKEDGLCIEYQIHNKGNDDMFFSTGSHYTYAVPIDKNDAYEEYVVEVGEQKEWYLKDDLFAEGAIILPKEEIVGEFVTIKGKRSGRETKVSFEGFPYCVIWSKPGIQPFVCIEPWAGLGDEPEKADLDLRKKTAIRSLKAGAHETFKQIVTLK